MTTVARGRMRTASGLRLQRALVSVREDRHLTREAVAEALELAPSTLSRIERGEAIPQPRNLRALLGFYEVTGERQDELFQLAKAAREAEGWLHAYEGVIPELYAQLIAFEADAARVANYESLLVPGLLQTEEYARSVIAGTQQFATPAEIERRVEIRMQRQAVLSGDKPLNLEVVIDEAVLHRAVGGSAVMRPQLKALRTSNPAVDLRVIPFATGAHPGMIGSFLKLGFDGGVGDLVYMESFAGELFRETDTDSERFGAIFGLLQSRALNPTDSRSLIEQIEKRHKGRNHVGTRA